MEESDKITCNSCDATVDGIAYKTRCNHLFCPSCAKAAFQRSSFCPLCSTNLVKGEVDEVNIGVASLPLMNCLYQNAFRECSWESAIHNVHEIREGTDEVIDFLMAQLSLRNTTIINRTKGLENQFQNMEAENVGYKQLHLINLFVLIFLY
jgi:predicted RNA-binding Zn-ribbon protein involved in translation (DUF1610 family)